MLLAIQGEVMASGNPSYLTNLVPGGANAQVAGTSSNPFPGVRVEQLVREVVDNTTTTPAISGACLAVEFLKAVTTPGAQYWTQTATANTRYGYGNVGVVFKPAPAQGAQALVVVGGPVMAMVQTVSNAKKAITVGDPLCLDANGYLTSAPTLIAATMAGTIVAQSLAVIAASTAAGLNPVIVGGW